MGRGFDTMQGNVGANVQDTSTAFATEIGKYINKRYQQVLRKINWDYINEDYTVTLVGGTQDYTLPSDFKSELYANISDNDGQLSRIELQDLVREYPGDMTTQSDVERYSVYNSDDGEKYIRFHYVPTKAQTVQLPYIVKPTALSGSTENILDIEDLLELGATADAWRYKRQFGKAQAMDILFEKELSEHIFAQENQENMVHKFTPKVTSRDTIY